MKWIMTALVFATFAWANAPQAAWADLDRMKDAKEDIQREKKDAKGDAKQEKKRAKRDLKH